LVNTYLTIATIYEDERYHLDLLPYTIKNGEHNHYLQHIGFIGILLPSFVVILASILCFTYFVFYDPYVCLSKDNKFRWLNIKNGYEAQANRLPLVWHCSHIGYRGWDRRTLFYQEIEQAIEYRKTNNKQLN
jgi:hypothetical protein